MIKRLSPVLISEKDELNRSLAEWIFNSHYLIEQTPGYYICKWCKMHITSSQPITLETPLCKENPILKKKEDKISITNIKNDIKRIENLQKEENDFILSNPDFTGYLSIYHLPKVTEIRDEIKEIENKYIHIFDSVNIEITPMESNSVIDFLKFAVKLYEEYSK